MAHSHPRPRSAHDHQPNKQPLTQHSPNCPEDQISLLTVTGLAYAIFRIEHPTLKPWQLLFLIEGGATCLVALFAWMWLPNGPESAWFLTSEERRVFRRCEVVNHPPKKSNGVSNDTKDVESQLAAAVLSADDDVEEEASGQHHVGWQDVVETVRDWKLWFLLLCNICASVPSTAFSVFLPLVVEAMGYSSLQANLVGDRPMFLTVVLPVQTR